MGNNSAYPGPEGACSGFLVEEGNTNLLVDCGTGVLANLQKHRDLRSVSDIVISHIHADHFFDLIPYRYALKYGLRAPQTPRPRLYLPPGGVETLARVVSPFAESQSFFADVFAMSEYDPKGRLPLEDVAVSFAAVLHYIPSYAIAITGSKKIAYSSDSGPCPGLLEIAASADLFLCNIGACLREGDPSLWGHLTPKQAGTAAREARAKRLVLTHLWPACDRSLSLKEASQAFGGPVELAELSRTYDV